MITFFLWYIFFQMHLLSTILRCLKNSLGIASRMVNHPLPKIGDLKTVREY